MLSVSHVTWNSQPDCFISAEHSYATLKFVYDIGFWFSKIPPLWQNYKAFGDFLRAYLVSGKKLTYFGEFICNLETFLLLYLNIEQIDWKKCKLVTSSSSDLLIKTGETLLIEFALFRIRMRLEVERLKEREKEEG